MVVYLGVFGGGCRGPFCSGGPAFVLAFIALVVFGSSRHCGCAVVLGFRFSGLLLASLFVSSVVVPLVAS